MDQPAQWDSVTLTFTPRGNSCLSNRPDLNVFGIGKEIHAKSQQMQVPTCCEVTVLTTVPLSGLDFILLPPEKKGKKC